MNNDAIFVRDIAKIRESQFFLRLKETYVLSEWFKRRESYNHLARAERLVSLCRETAVKLGLDPGLTEAIALQRSVSNNILFGHEGERFFLQKLNKPFSNKYLDIDVKLMKK